NAGFRLHRIVLANPVKDLFIIRGDCGQQDDPALNGSQILGLAYGKEVRLGPTIVQARFRGIAGWLLRSAARAQYLGARALRKSGNMASRLRGVRSLICALGLLLAVGISSAQVQVDGTSTNGAANLTGVANSATLNFTHTTGTGPNRLLIVGVSV